MEDSEEAFGYARSRELFLKYGDKNSKYFQLKSKGRQSTNKINYIKTNDVWLNNRQDLETTFVIISPRSLSQPILVYQAISPLWIA